MLYVAVVVVATRHPKPTFTFADPTVVTVTDRPGPAILHAPAPIYPPVALHDGVEGSVKFKVAIAADGTVARAHVVDGPAPLVDAALAVVWQYQYEAKAAETDLDIEFSLQNATRSYSPPQPVERRNMHGAVRVVATVNPQGRVDVVQPVSGPEERVHDAIEAVRQWKFQAALRNGQPTYGTVVIDLE